MKPCHYIFDFLRHHHSWNYENLFEKNSKRDFTVHPHWTAYENPVSISGDGIQVGLVEIVSSVR